MPRFFVQSSAICDNTITISGSDASHISRSLRMKVGDFLTVCDMQRSEFLCQITDITPDSVHLRIFTRCESQNEPPYFATLYMALPKADKMELIIQKAVEMGVSRIVPVRSERSVVKLSCQDGVKKQQRWQKIADSAAGQCGRGILPQITEPMDFADAVKDAAKAELPFFCYEGEDAFSLKDLASRYKESPKTIAFFVGSEGGICQKEVDMLQNAGLFSVGLGKRILRCESAPMFVLSCLSLLWEI